MIGFEGAQHDVGNLVGAMRPDVDDLVVAFARGNDTLAVLLLDLANLLLRGLDFLLLFLRDDHVIDADGNAGASRLTEAKLFELVEHDNGLLVAANLIAAPDEVAEV